MHEWALAESVVKTAAEYAGREKLRSVTEVSVLLGELQAIDKEIFVFALKELVNSSFKGLASCKFKIIVEPAAFKCKSCAKEFSLKTLKKTDAESENIHFIPEMAHAFLKCPECGTPDFEVTAGRGVSIKQIKGRK